MIRQMNAPTTILMIAGCLLVSGCASMQGLEPPEVTLVDLRAGEVTVFETTLDADIRITNPNPEAFDVEGASFKLQLGGGRVGTGVSSEVFTVERLDSHVVTVTFRINNAAALLRLGRILDEPDIEYGVKTTLFTRGAFGLRKIKASQHGVLRLGEPIGELSDQVDEI